MTDLEIYFREITATLEEELSVKVTASAVCKFLKKAGFTRQHSVNYASQQSDELRSIFSNELALYPTHTLEFLSVKQEVMGGIQYVKWDTAYVVVLQEERKSFLSEVNMYLLL